MNTSRLLPNQEPSRANALAQLRAFIPKAGRAYTQFRNTDYGPAKNTAVSQLSPFIRHRLITEVEVLNAVLAHHRFHDAEKFVHEVFWRSYFKGYLEARPEIWQHYLAARDYHIEALARNSALASDYNDAITGKTGIDCFDAWVKELIETGYLHNHARMWFASIWIFTLKLPWELGADFTLRYFLDGDPASNTLSWRWVGGLHTKGKIYLARSSNIEEFTNGRFSPKGLATEASPLSEAPIARSTPLDNKPLNIELSDPALLLLTGEDLHPESLECGKTNVQYIVGTHSAAERSHLPVSPAVIDFSDGALNDALIRSQSYFKANYEAVRHLTADDLIQLANQHNVKKIIMPHATVGPIADQLPSIKLQLAEHMIELVSLTRQEDQRIWPHTKKGFFELKNHIPRILEDLAIQSR